MARNRIMVPFGYEPIETNIKGTIFVIDSFNNISPKHLSDILQLADERDFDKVIFYPQHEQTLKRMGIDTLFPYHDRVKSLERLLDSLDTEVYYGIDKWEGKRKKYTPIETALAFLMEKHKGPYFLYLDLEVANKFIEFKSFEELIKKVRLIIKSDFGGTLNPKFDKYQSRIELT